MTLCQNLIDLMLLPLLKPRWQSGAHHPQRKLSDLRLLHFDPRQQLCHPHGLTIEIIQRREQGI